MTTHSSKIRLKRGTGVPSPTSLVTGEIAINTFNGFAYTITDSGEVKQIGKEFNFPTAWSTDWEWLGNYNNGITYQTGQAVRYNQAVWYCFDGSNLSGGYPPSVRPANWVKVFEDTTVDLTGYLPLTGGTMSGTLTVASEGYITDVSSSYVVSYNQDGTNPSPYGVIYPNGVEAGDGEGNSTWINSSGIRFPDNSVQTTASYAPDLSGYSLTSVANQSYYPLNSNPSGYLTSSNLSPYLTATQVASNYYPLGSNPSNYLTSSALSPYLTATQVASGYYPLGSNPSGYLTSSALTSYITTTQALSNYYPLNSNPAGYLTSQTLPPLNYLPLSGGIMSNEAIIDLINPSSEENSGSVTNISAGYIVIGGDIGGGNPLNYTSIGSGYINFRTDDGPNVSSIGSYGITFPDSSVQTTAASDWKIGGTANENISLIFPKTDVNTTYNYSTTINAGNVQCHDEHNNLTATFSGNGIEWVSGRTDDSGINCDLYTNDPYFGSVIVRNYDGITLGGTGVLKFSDGTIQTTAAVQQNLSQYLTKSENLSGISNVSSARTNLGLGTMAVETASNFALLNSPTFTGDPKAPTPLLSDNDTSIATTAFVKGQNYAGLSSPSFTGNPTATTQLSSDNSNNIATTAFVKAQNYLTNDTTFNTSLNKIINGGTLDVYQKFILNSSGLNSYREYRLHSNGEVVNPDDYDIIPDYVGIQTNRIIIADGASDSYTVINKNGFYKYGSENFGITSSGVQYPDGTIQTTAYNQNATFLQHLTWTNNDRYNTGNTIDTGHLVFESNDYTPFQFNLHNLSLDTDSNLTTTSNVQLLIDRDGVFSLSSSSASINGTGLNFNSIINSNLGLSVLSSGMSLTKSTTTTALTVTQIGTGNAFVVNDSSSDNTPFVIDQYGHVGIGTQPSSSTCLSIDSTGIKYGDGTIQTTAFTSSLLSPYLTSVSANNTYATLASPIFTGDPKAPTPLTNDNDTSIATTAFVKNQGYLTQTSADSFYYPLNSNPSGYLTDASLSGYATQSYVTSQGYITLSALTPYETSTHASSTYQTISGMSSYLTSANVATNYYPLNSNPSGYLTSSSLNGYATQSYVTSQGYITLSALSIYATLASPTFTGDPKAPTPATADNDTSIATTAFVKAQGYATIASPTFTGDPKAPTPLLTDNDTSIATTAFVKGQNYLTSSPVVSVSGKIGSVTLETTDISGLSSTYATLSSPVFTGDPKAPTPSNLDNDTSIATTAFVKNQGYAQLAGASFTGDVTFNEITSHEYTSNFFADVNLKSGNSLSLYNSITDTGAWGTLNATALTMFDPASNGNNTAILSSSGILQLVQPYHTTVLNGTKLTITDTSVTNTKIEVDSLGLRFPNSTSTIGANYVSVSPTQIKFADGTNQTTAYNVSAFNAYAPLLSPTFTGDPKAPTPTTEDNDTSIATTAFVKNQGYAQLTGASFTGKVNINNGTNAAPLNIGSNVAAVSNSSAGDFWISTTYAQYKDSSNTIRTIPTTSTGNNFTQNQTITVSSSVTPSLTVIQNGNGGGLLVQNPTGNGYSFKVEDSTSPDTTPFIIDANGRVGIGIVPDTMVALAVDSTGIKFSDGTIQTTAGVISNAVTSVAGRTGNVIIASDDVAGLSTYYANLGASNIFNVPQNVTVTNQTVPALTISQNGTSPSGGGGGGLLIQNPNSLEYSLKIEDATSPDPTPLIVDNAGHMGIGVSPDAVVCLAVDSTGIKFSDSSIQTKAAWGTNTTSQNGYMKLGNGMIIAWGKTSTAVSAGTTGTVTFPSGTGFTNCLSVQITTEWGTGTSTTSTFMGASVKNISSTQFTFVTNFTASSTSATGLIWWTAIGY